MTTNRVIKTTPRYYEELWTGTLAQQAIRLVVLDRHVTQGTGNERGRQCSKRIWSGIATCTRQQRSVFEFLHQQPQHLHFFPQVPERLPEGCANIEI